MRKVYVRTQIVPWPKRFGQGPNKPTTINMLESGFNAECLTSQK